jgi:spore germination cell wall hydrolase CwlJ-like protein
VKLALAFLLVMLITSIDRREVGCLTEAVYHEARGEPFSGRVAVALVVRNRVLDRRFPKSYCGVIHQRGQFTYRAGPIDDVTSWLGAVAIATVVQLDLVDDEHVAGAVFYYSPTDVKKKPKWAKHGVLIATIGKHEFRK